MPCRLLLAGGRDHSPEELALATVVLLPDIQQPRRAAVSAARTARVCGDKAVRRDMRERSRRGPSLSLIGCAATGAATQTDQ